MFRSIRLRLAGSYLLLVLFAVTAMGILVLTFVQGFVEKREREYLRANAQAVALQARRFFIPQANRIALKELAITSAFLGDARVRILESGGGIVADSGDPGMPDKFLWFAPPPPAQAGGGFQGAPFLLPMPPPAMGPPPGFDEDLRYNIPPGTARVYARRMPSPWGRLFVFEGEQVPPAIDAPPPSRKLISITVPIGAAGESLGFVELSGPLSFGGEALRMVMKAILFSGLGALLLAVCCGLFIGKTISDPLRDLTRTARLMAGGDLAARAPAGRGDEIGALARQFNAMAGSLDESFRELHAERDSLKRFVADASHELRTPITALATFNELLQSKAADDPTTRREFLEESQAQIERLRWIVTNLLDLSRLDAGVTALNIGEHGVNDLIRSALSSQVDQAERKGVRLSFQDSHPLLSLACDRERMILALSNLIANAVKFTPSGGLVTIAAEVTAGEVQLTVSDKGPGIDEEDLPRIFERFYRGKHGRAEGAGLGLAIVQSVARAHCGSVNVQSQAGKGSLFTIQIPISRKPTK